MGENSGRAWGTQVVEQAEQGHIQGWQVGEGLGGGSLWPLLSVFVSP